MPYFCIFFQKKILLDYLVCSTTSTTYIHFQHNNTVHLTVFPWIQAVLFQVKISKSETIFPNVMQKVQRVSYLIWKNVLIWKDEFWDFFFTHSPRQMCWMLVNYIYCENERLRDWKFNVPFKNLFLKKLYRQRSTLVVVFPLTKFIFKI